MILIQMQIQIALELQPMLTASDPISQKIYYQGTDSPCGCGSNSKYYVSWTIRRL